MKAEVEIEGDRWSWWYVCGECHGAVDPKDKTCPGCSAELDWEKTLLVGRKEDEQ